jgi:general secretion pathway protein I
VRADRGITLIELVIAVFDQARRAIGEESLRLFAHEVAMNRAEALRLMGAEAGRDLPATVRFGPHEWTLRVDEAPTAIGLVRAEIRVQGEGRPGARLVAHIRPGGAP